MILQYTLRDKLFFEAKFEMIPCKQFVNCAAHNVYTMDNQNLCALQLFELPGNINLRAPRITVFHF